MSASTLFWLERRSPRELARWAVAAVVVVGIHAGVLVYLFMAPRPDVIGDMSEIGRAHV